MPKITKFDWRTKAFILGYIIWLITAFLLLALKD